jgi:DNA-binding MarR family transcriptional regulator
MDESLLQEAEQLVKYLRDIRSILKRTDDMDTAGISLTAPQVDVLRELVATNGMSLKELSKRLGLAHSTVSGIVDRLERDNLVYRSPDPDDKRITRIYAGPSVLEYTDRTMYLRRGSVVAQALQQATPEDREQIIGGITKLYALLTAGADHDTE